MELRLLRSIHEIYAGNQVETMSVWKGQLSALGVFDVYRPLYRFVLDKQIDSVSLL